MSIRRRVVAGSVLALGALLSIGIVFVHRGFSAIEKPSWIETALARHIRTLAVPPDAKRLKIAYEPTRQVFWAASDHWLEHCAVCHGTDGHGNSVIGRNLYPKASDMAATEVQSLADGELFYIISNGVRFTGMPGWGNEDSPEEIWQLVTFIRMLPKMTPEELKLLEQKAVAPTSHTDHAATPEVIERIQVR
jgi:cytochrome c553